MGEAAGGGDLAEEDVGEAVAQFLTVVGEVKDGGDVLLAPGDGVGEAGDEDLDCVWVGGVDELDELFLFEGEGAAVYSFTAVAGGCAFFPVGGVAVGVVADDDDGDIGFGRGGDCGDGIVAFFKLDVDAFAEGLADSS